MKFQPAPSNVKPLLVTIVIILVVTMAFPLWIGVRTAWGMLTMSYAVTPSDVVIVFGPSRTTIPLDTVTDVYELPSTSGGRRHMGTSVQGLKEGQWSFRETGRITLYATKTKDLVVIESDGGQWGITPDDPAQFVEAVAQRTPMTFAPSDLAGPTSALWLIGIILTVTIFPIVLIFRYAGRISKRLAYEIIDNAVVVRGGREQITIPFADIEHIETTELKGTPFRVWGVGLPGLYWGSYMWRQAGPNLFMCATHLRPLTLIRTEHRTYGLTPADAERFTREVENRLNP